MSSTPLPANQGPQGPAIHVNEEILAQPTLGAPPAPSPNQWQPSIVAGWTLKAKSPPTVNPGFTVELAQYITNGPTSSAVVALEVFCGTQKITQTPWVSKDIESFIELSKLLTVATAQYERSAPSISNLASSNSSHP